MRIQTVSNPFYAEIQRSGIIIDVTRPKAGSVTNPYLEQIKASGGIQLGRPRRGEKPRPTIVRSVRISPKIWKRVEKQAAREKISTNAAVQQALLIWLRS